MTAEFLVSSIDGLTATGNVSKEFVAYVSAFALSVVRLLHRGGARGAEGLEWN